LDDGFKAFATPKNFMPEQEYVSPRPGNDLDPLPELHSLYWSASGTWAVVCWGTGPRRRISFGSVTTSSSKW
jgi:hypothetical protein